MNEWITRAENVVNTTYTTTSFMSWIQEIPWMSLLTVVNITTCHRLPIIFLTNSQGLHLSVNFSLF